MHPVPLYEMFPFLKNNDALAADYSGASVVSVTVNSSKTKMDIRLNLPHPVAPFEIANMENCISGEYGMEKVHIEAGFASGYSPAPAAAKASDSKQTAPAEKTGKASKVIMGHISKAVPKPIRDVTIDDGKAAVRGQVCAVRSRPIERNNSILLNFDISDNTSSINVSKFMQEGRAQKIAESIQEGMYLTVTGTLSISNRDGELTLSPQNIFISEKELREDTSEKKRVELHLHTKMSATDGLTDVKKAIGRAAAWGHSAIAITDHGVVHCFPDAAEAAYKAAKKTGREIKIIYGLEGYLRQGAPPDDKIKKGRNYHIIILAKNKTGLKNLYKIVSKSHIEHFYQHPLIFKSVLEEHREGLILGSACEKGELFSALIEKKSDDELYEIARFYDYLEIQPLCNNRFLIESKECEAKSDDDLRAYNKKIVQIGETLDIPVVATCDAHFLDPEDEIYRKIILTGKKFENAGKDLPIYLRTTDEMLEEFSYLGADTAYKTVVANTNLIAGMCGPISPLPPKDKFYPPMLEGSAMELEKLILQSTSMLYGENPPQLIVKRIDDELKAILGLSYDVIYMTAQKLVAYLKSEGSRVGSRGSVGSSFVAYLAGITEVNPLPAHYRCPACRETEFPSGNEDNKIAYVCGADMPDKNCPACGEAFIKDGFNIPFETFLGFTGEKIPDIDLNISGEHQKKAQNFVYGMFGRDYVFRAGTISTIAKETAYGFVKKYLETNNLTVPKAEINRLAAGCIGVKQTTGQHPGGLVIIPQDMEVTDFCPVQYPADGRNKEKDKSKGENESVITMHFDYHKMEDYLIKLDTLGHDNPTMLLQLEEMTGINADEIRLDDPETISIFSSPLPLGLPEDDEIIGKTGAIGIPEFGTPFVRQMLCETKPGNFDTLIRLSGYSHGTNVWLGNARELIAEGKATVAQTISSRDDIMLYLISKGMDNRDAFTVSESVRKGRGLPEGAEDKMFALKIPQWYMDSCSKITYLFPKAHAVAYVIMAFRIAWFKVHKPLEYYSAHFYRRSQGGAFDAETMTRGINTVKGEIERIGNLKESTKKDEEMLATLESCYEFYLRGFDFVRIDLYESDAKRFLPVDSNRSKGSLRPPFVAVNGLGKEAARSLAENRKGRRFISIEEIGTLCHGVTKTNLEDLSRLGALGDLPATSQMSLF